MGSWVGTLHGFRAGFITAFDIHILSANCGMTSTAVAFENSVETLQLFRIDPDIQYICLQEEGASSGRSTSLSPHWDERRDLQRFTEAYQALPCLR